MTGLLLAWGGGGDNGVGDGPAGDPESKLPIFWEVQRSPISEYCGEYRQDLDVDLLAADDR
jgi:hypothetical protein